MKTNATFAYSKKYIRIYFNRLKNAVRSVYNVSRVRRHAAREV